MSQWFECTLNDIGEIVGGATPLTAKKEYYGGEIPWITPKDLSSHQNRYIAKGERNITKAGLNSCSATLLPKNTILFTSRAPIGYIAISSTELCTNQGFKSIIPKEEIDKLFVYYLLVYNRNKIISMGSGTTFKEVSGKEMKSIEVKIPQTFRHQKKIASILGRIDDKIELNNKLNDNLQQQVATIFKAWFVDFVPFDETMPSNWTVSTLGDVTEMGAGGDKPKETSQVKTPLYPYPIYSNGINNYGLYGYTNEPKIKSESVTVSARGTIGYVCLRHIPYVSIVRLVTLIPDTSVLSAKYLYLYLSQLHITGTGTTQQQLTVPDFRKTEIIIPDKATMDFFTETVTPLFEQIWVNEDENNKLAEVRDALLPKLMSGEIDVSNIQV